MSSDASTRLDPHHYLDALAGDSARFVEVLAEVPAGTRVPTCPDWDVDDLLDHLAQVQSFWARIVAGPLTDDAQVQALEPWQRAADRAGLLDAARSATADLLHALRDTSPETPAWTWSPHDRTVGFTFRRQAHEALVHRLDAELTAAPDGSARTPIDPMLADDGVDEVLRLAADHPPAWAEVTREESRMLRVVASDTGRTWLVTMTRLRGTDDAGTDRDRPGIHVADVDPADGTVRPSAILTGAAEDLDGAFWGRPTVGDLQRTGDTTLLAEFEGVLAGRG